MNPFSNVRLKPDFRSLRWRLTLGVAVVSISALSGLSAWISWRMQRILIATQKQNVYYIAERFPHDVEIYSDMVSLEEGAQRAINNLTNRQTLIWLKNSQDRILAQSDSTFLSVQELPLITSELETLSATPELHKINGRFWLMCVNDLRIKGQTVGQFYIAQDITGDQTMFLSLLKSLSLATAITLLLMTLLIAWYVQHSLQPLDRISQLSANVSIDQLSQARLHLENAPQGVKKLAQTFDQMLDRLSQAWDHQQQLLSNVSHELRTPLTIVSGYLQSLLRRGTNLTQPQREALETAISETERTTQLLQDLLDLARADSGYMIFQRESIMVNSLLMEVTVMTQQYSHRQIDFQDSDSVLKIKVDKNRLKQVLLNLIDNAIKYSPADTPITLHLKRQNQQVIIEVCDQGIGIPLADQGRIFERFYRVDSARSRSTGGTGLGLSIVKTLVEGMGGTIQVLSNPNQGSIFSLSFPLSFMSKG